MNEFGDLLGTPYAPVSKIAPVKTMSVRKKKVLYLEINHDKEQKALVTYQNFL